MRGLTDRHDASPLVNGDCCSWCHRVMVQPETERRREATGSTDQLFRIDLADEDQTQHVSRSDAEINPSRNEPASLHRFR